jgi:hypothetical protein
MGWCATPAADVLGAELRETIGFVVGISDRALAAAT